MLSAHRMMLSRRVSPPPAFVAATSATSSAVVSSIAATIPASAAVGNLLVLAASMRGTQTFSTPSGWTLAQQENDGIAELRAWYRVCQAGDAGSTVTVSVSGGGSEVPSVACLAYSSADTTTPLFASRFSVNSSSTSTWDAGQIDLTTAPGPCLVVEIWAAFAAGAHPLTLPGAVTGRVDVSSSGNSRMLAVADEVASAGGITPTRTATPTASQPYVAVTLAFNGTP